MTRPPDARDDHPADVAEEVSRLAEAVHSWWTSARGSDLLAEPQPATGQRRAHDQHEQSPVGTDDAVGGDSVADDDAAHRHADHTPDAETSSCRICPLCRALDVVRAVRPELLQQVAAAAETVAVLLREAAGDPDRHAADRPPPPADETDRDDAVPDDGDLRGLFSAGTPIVVTEGRERSTDEHDDEGGRTAWA